MQVAASEQAAAEAAPQSDDLHDCETGDLVSSNSEAHSAEDEPRSVDVSTMTDTLDVFFSADFTFVSETSNGNASSFIKHREVRTTDMGSSSHPDMLEKSSGPVCKQPVFAGYESVQDNEDALHELTAVNFAIFALLLSILPPTPRKLNELSIENKLLLFLIKLKHGLPFSVLGVLFNVHRTTTSRIFKGLLVNITAATKTWLHWPSRRAVLATLPPSFREHYPNCRVIIDCTELETEVPRGVEKQNLWYSQYKGRHTVKYLIGIAPNGLVLMLLYIKTFLSKGFGGRTTDATITVQSDFLSLLEPGDLVLADKGFPGIRTSVGEKNATLVMPPFATSPQFTESEVDATYETASVRIHVERVIQRLKIFDIITHKIPYELTGYCDEILHVLSVITNLKSHIFAKRAME
ncbi:uncharacterized protein LOC119403592 [Rhipicephalus sanguineus]|uniref:uncharacterized protein LOC119403592 n=1 Tax=Rhipicephalus sanguineus TaxID=34632 RepID=UPI0020C52B45|nr:uncharacterized protein LOC119403592 [Rhipicephalus sanguineus]